MKKTIALMLASAMFFAAQAFTTTALLPEPISEKISAEAKLAFSGQFAEAVNVTWAENQGLYFARFEMEGTRYTSAFTNDGELVAVCREIGLEKLPFAVSRALKQQYAGFTMSAVATELVMNGATTYHLTVAGKTKIYQLSSTPSGSISVEKKIKKH